MLARDLSRAEKGQVAMRHVSGSAAPRRGDRGLRPRDRRGEAPERLEHLLPRRRHPLEHRLRLGQRGGGQELVRGIDVVHDVPWKPHAGLVITIKAAAEYNQTGKLNMPKAFTQPKRQQAPNHNCKRSR